MATIDGWRGQTIVGVRSRGSSQTFWARDWRDLVLDTTGDIVVTPERRQDRSVAPVRLRYYTRMDLLFKLRRARGLTQDQLARESGVGKKTIQRIELGRVVPKLDTAKSLADALGVDPMAIVEGAGLLRRVNATMPKVLDERFAALGEQDLNGMPDEIKAAIVDYYQCRRAWQSAQIQLEGASERCTRATNAFAAREFRARTDSMLEERHDANLAFMHAVESARACAMRASEAGIELQAAHMRLYFH